MDYSDIADAIKSIVHLLTADGPTGVITLLLIFGAACGYWHIRTWIKSTDTFKNLEAKFDQLEKERDNEREKTNERLAEQDRLIADVRVEIAKATATKISA